MKLTEGNIAKAIREAQGKSKSKSECIAWDDELHGFGLRVRDGTRSWIFQYKIGERQHRMRLGGSELSCNAARALAEAQRGAVAKAKLGHGDDPAIEREKKKVESKPKPRGKTLASLIADYLGEKVAAMKPRSYDETKRHLEKHFEPLHNREIQTIERLDVAARVREIAKQSGPVAANRARASLSAMFAWAIGEGLCDSNPVAGTNKQEEAGPRERSLSDAEAATAWAAAPDNDYGRILKLILLTGCRRDEIGGLRWSEIDLGSRVIILPKQRTKNKTAHTIPLSDAALAILKDIPRRADRDFVFGIGQGGYSGWSKSKGELNKVLKLKEAWTVHDLRRTVRTGLGKLNVQPHIAEAVLNHLPPELIRTYDRNTYAVEKKAALDLWASHLMVAVAQATGANVTTIKSVKPRS
jgi:integrase